MKVLVLSHMYPNPVNPHAGVFVHNQCKALANAGIELQVVCPTPAFPIYPKWKGYRDLPTVTEYEGITVHYIPTRMFPSGLLFSTYGYWYEKSLLPVVSEIRKTFSFDLIHCHTIFPDGYAGIRLKKHLQVPILSTIHGSDIMLYPKRSKGVYQKTLQALQQHNQVVTVSQRLQMEAESICPQAKIQTVYNGFDPVQFAPVDQRKAREHLGLPLDQKICMFIGNLYPVKGLSYLLQSFAKVKAQHNDLHLYLVGEGMLKNTLQAEAESLNLEKAVSWMGRKPYEEIPSWIQSADVMVLSSLSEGLPSILLESMACGRPMIATDVGGIAEVLQDDQTGRLVPARDVEALAGALNELFCQYPEKTEQMGEAAAQASQAYTWQKNAEQIIRCYQAMIEDV